MIRKYFRSDEALNMKITKYSSEHVISEILSDPENGIVRIAISSKYYNDNKPYYYLTIIPEISAVVDLKYLYEGSTVKCNMPSFLDNAVKLFYDSEPYERIKKYNDIPYHYDYLIDYVPRVLVIIIIGYI